MDDLLREERLVNPEYCLDSETEVNSNNCSVSERPNSSQENLDVTASCFKRRKTSLQEYVENAEICGDLQTIISYYRGAEDGKGRRKEANYGRKITLLESLVLLLKEYDQ